MQRLILHKATTWGGAAEDAGLMLQRIKQILLHDSNEPLGTSQAIQLEVGEVATAFEHRSYGDELAKSVSGIFIKFTAEWAFCNIYFRNTRYEKYCCTGPGHENCTLQKNMQGLPVNDENSKSVVQEHLLVLLYIWQNQLFSALLKVLVKFNYWMWFA